MDKERLYSELSKGNRPWLPDGENFHVPILPTFVKTNTNLGASSRDFNEVFIIPEKLNYEFCLDKDMHHVDHVSEAVRKLYGKVQLDMCLLERADIPVFLHNNTEPKTVEYRDEFSIQASYSIPEELMYKSFFVLNDFSEALKKGGEYAMQQVQKVIDKY